MENCGNFCFDFSSHPRWLRMVRTVVSECLLMIGIEEKDKIVTAVDEACSNIMRHGYGGSKDGRICLECHLGSESLEFTLKDFGLAIDPEKMNTKTSSEIKPGGMGLMLMRRYMDKVEYTRTENGENIMKMVKYAE